jgi:hypothetical protein
MSETSIVQGWAASLGLRHQGVLMSAIRGPDQEEREDVSKYLTRVYRGVVLRAHCGDIKKAATYMVAFDDEIWPHKAADFLRGFDHYPLHWLLHFMHACEIVGYKHPDHFVRDAFSDLYVRLVRKFHLLPEPELELDLRLSANERDFAQAQAV